MVNYIYYQSKLLNGDYVLDFTSSDPYDDKLVQKEDQMLHQTLSKIFRERCPTSVQMKKFLLTSKHTDDQDSLVKLILDLEPSLSEIFPERKLSLLWIAVLRCYRYSAELLVRSGADVNECCEIKLASLLSESVTILQLMIHQDLFSWNERFIGLLLEHGVDLEARDCFGRTALYTAVSHGQVQMTTMLLEKGADVNIVDITSMTPLLAVACWEAPDELLPILIKHGADVTVRNACGQNALHYLASAMVEHVDLARTLIEKGASLDDKIYKNQYQPLHVAVEERNSELVKLFLDYGANVNAQVDHGNFPLFIAVCRYNSTIVLTLLKSGANIDLKNKDGYTALHAACGCIYNEENIKLLLSVGADMFAEAHQDFTPIASIHDRQISHSRIKLMLRMLALKKACIQPSIELKDERMIKQDSTLQIYYQFFVEQISKAKSTRFIESCTFFDLLTKCHCKIAALMRNPEFESKFKRYNLKVFSAYAGDILGAFKRAQHYYHSVLEQEDVINEAVYYILPHLIVGKVARYVFKCEECEIKRIVHASRNCSDKSN